MRPALAAALLSGALALGGAVPAAEAADEPEHTCDGLTATIVGTHEGELIIGTDGDDVIVALGGQDTVRAGAGHDVVCGGHGGDVLEGGPGADRLFGELEDTSHDDGPSLKGDLLRGGPGDDYLDAGYDPSGGPNRDQLRWGESPRGVRLDLADGVLGASTGFGTDTLVLEGGPHHNGPMLVLTKHDDFVSGSPLRDRVKAGRGSDVVYARAGNDEIHLDADDQDRAGIDLVQAGAGDDRVFHRSGADKVFLGKGRDYFEGKGTHRVKVRGQRGPDYIRVDIGSGPGFSVRGDQGNDHISLVATNSTDPARRIVVDAAAGRVRFGGGPWGVLSGFRDHDLWGVGIWTFRGTAGPDDVTVFYGKLLARTFGGNDTLTGHDRPDRLDGGPGTDRANGRGGRDRCLNAEKRTSCEILR